MKPPISNAQSERQNYLMALGERAAALLHEVKSPLSVILLGLSSLETEALSHQNQLRLNLALEEAIRLKRMLNKSLLFVKCPQIKQQLAEI